MARTSVECTVHILIVGYRTVVLDEMPPPVLSHSLSRQLATFDNSTEM